MNNPENIRSLSGNLLDDLLRDLAEEETQENSFESRFSAALQEILMRMSPRGREIMQELIVQTAEDTQGRLPGLYRHICTMALLSASGQSSAPLRLPNSVVDFYLEHGDRPGSLIHTDTCRRCGAMVPFFNFFRENRLVRPFDVCPVCRNKMR